MAENVLDGKFICGNCQYFIADEYGIIGVIFSQREPIGIIVRTEVLVICAKKKCIEKFKNYI